MSKFAIIGISGLFPGSSTSEEFWDNLMAGKDLLSLANEEDFGADPALFFHPDKGTVDKCYSTRGGYIRNFKFDPKGFQTPAEKLKYLDKLYQWSLYVAKEALHESGYLNNKKALKKCGVILGNLSFPTGQSHKMMSEIYAQTTQQVLSDLLEDDTINIPSTNHDFPNHQALDVAPSKIVHEALGLGTTHYSLDAACATSLYAIKLACDELSTGKSDMMLAGAVCASDQLFIHIGFSIFHAYADEKSKFVPLDKDSGGLVSSEGAGMVVIKRLADAERDADNILAVICGIGLSNDGRGKFLLSPNPEGQKLAFERAYQQNGISPTDTSYLECHATGTPLGDVTELNSIADFFKQHHSKPLLGSVKSNMGHLLTAAAMSGLHKVVLSMKEAVIPPNINLQKGLNADNNWIGEQEMITQATKWEDAVKQAAINSFGFGGTNAHMVVQNYVKNQAASVVHKKVELAPMGIIGMDAHFGNCSNLDDFYLTIYDKKQHFRELPKERWKGLDQNKKLLKSFGFENGVAPRGAYIEDFEIDLLRYKIQPAEAATLEPQQALILKVADQAIIDAGLKEGQNVAVLIAMESEPTIHHYLARWDLTWQLDALRGNSDEADQDALKNDLLELSKNAIYHREGKQTPSQHTSFVGNIMASRIAALWDFSGPAFTVSAGEHSAFKALEIAQNLLSAGEVDAVVVGAVDFSGGLEQVLFKNKKQPVNSKQKPSFGFNKNEEGYLIGEGAGAVVLKRSTDIQEDDKPYAIIDKIGAHLDLEEVALHELTDGRIPYELPNNKCSSYPALGSIEANIGHTAAASGMASLIKTALCLHHKFIPGIPNWEAPKTVLLDAACYFPNESRPWILNEKQNSRKAVVQGLEGIQVKLSEPVEQAKASRKNSFLQKNIPSLFVLKGANEAALHQKLEELKIALTSKKPLREIAADFYSASKHSQGNLILVLVGKTKKDLNREIRFFKTKLADSISSNSPIKTPKGSYFAPNPLGKKGKLALMYPGSATAYAGLGKDLFQLFPQLLEDFRDIEKDFEKFMAVDYLYPKKKSRQEADPDIYENAITMMSAGVFFSKMWTHILTHYFGLQPDIAAGYSMGECSSMFYANQVWNAEHAQVFRHSPIFKNRFTGNLDLLAEHWNISSAATKDKWVGLVLLASSVEVEKLVAAHSNVYLTFINTNNEVVISGDRTICYQIAAQLNCQTIEIPFQNIIHHEFCRAEWQGLIEMHNFELNQQPDLEFFSSLSQNTLDYNNQSIAQNSAEVCCQTVDFPKTVKTLYEKGVKLFVEVGAGATCTTWINSILEHQEFHAVSADQKGKSDGRTLVELLAQLTSHGLDIDLSILFPEKESSPQKRSFYKKIRPGGKRIYDTILTTENRQKYAALRNPKHLTAELAFEISTTSSASIFANSTNKNTDLAVLELKKPALLPTKKDSTKMNYTDTKSPKNLMDKKPVRPPSHQEHLAENGLPISNFATGEHLVGKNVLFTQEDLREFAYGSIAKVFGEKYSIIDSYRRRTMLPMEPYLLVSRVTGLKGERGKFEPSTMQTEYDIPHDAWFTTDRQIPWAVSVESGQCDLLLISYLGIDFQAKGDLVYRLLDCTLTFVDDLPFEGQTLRYDISINSFVRNGDNLLFFFSYRCYVHDRLVLKMDGGCAGYFKDDELETGSGVVYKKSEIEARQHAVKRHFVPLLNTEKTSFSKEDLKHLIHGAPEKCFDDISYFANGRNPSLCLPPEKILMLDRIVSVDLKGGAYGLGYIVAEKDLSTEDWFFPCHFRDDEVLAGSLQAEGGGNLLRFFMLMLGLQRLTKDARYQPIFDLPQKVRCRKQVVPGKDTKLIYKLEIKEIGLTPNPYVIGDLEIISNDIITVHFENLGLQLREKDNPRYLEVAKANNTPSQRTDVLLDEKAIEEFALGDMSKAFGKDFDIYEGRTSSRQPNTDLQVISRILSIDGTRGDFSKPSTCIAEYDVPEKVWYYEQNSTQTLPYSILMEIALQPCGLMGAYLGSTLQFPDKDLYFRNLDGDGEMFDLPAETDFRGKTIRNKATLKSSVALGGTVIQNYTFECSVDGHVFYAGKSSFGFFPGEALASQVGLDNGKDIPSWYEAQNLQPKDYMQIKLDSLYGKMKLYKAPAGKPHYRLAEDQLNLIDNLRIVKNGGEHGKGYVHATRFMQPYDWFFTCHFYTDPVMPGSLGVEAMLQALQVFALQQDLGKNFVSPKFVQLPNHQTKWKYRGQIFRHVEKMHLEIHIKSIEKRGDVLAIIGDAFLWNEGMRIYQVTDLALGIEEA